MTVDHVFAMLEASALAEAIRRAISAYPALEIMHIASFGVPMGSLLVFDLRLFGFERAIHAVQLARLALGTSLVAFLFAAASGALLFLSGATEFAAHPAFRSWC